MAAKSRFIPLEITLMIIDEISSQNDHETLSSFSQTCKILLPYCRRILFSSIEFNLFMWSRNKASALNDLMACKGNEEVASYVHEFSYSIDLGNFNAHDWEVISIIQRLSHVRRLELFFQLQEVDGDHGYTIWDELPYTMKDALMGVLSLDSLEKLHMNGIRNFPISGIWSAKSLGDLEISAGVNFTQHSGSDLTGLHGPPRLARFAVMDGGPWPGIEFLLGPSGIRDDAGVSLSAVDFSILEELSVIIGNREEWDTTREIIEIGRNTLQHIHYDFMPDNARQDSRGLGECITDTDNGMPNLKSLKFVWWTDDFDNESDDEGAAFMGGFCEELSILEKASDKHVLERIDINIRIYNGPDFSTDLNDWGKLKDIFLRPGFQNLRNLRINVVIHPSNLRPSALLMRLLELKDKVFRELAEKEGLEFDYFVNVSD